jgi:hypothetical protein
MTKFISILILAALLLVAWKVFQYWEKVENERETAKREAAVRVVVPEQLPGLPREWEPSLQAAAKQGPTALGNWLEQYGRGVQDPRKAWIELDYCVMLTRENPAEARRIFAAVRDRTPVSSPVWPRIRELAKSYE